MERHSASGGKNEPNNFEDCFFNVRTLHANTELTTLSNDVVTLRKKGEETETNNTIGDDKTPTKNGKDRLLTPNLEKQTL